MASGSVRGHGLELGLHDLLRLGCCAEFIGHGMFGILTTAAWLPYFGAAGISEAHAFRRMPLVGTVDLFLGILVVVRPLRWPLLYVACWGLWTALLRPLAGETAWETVERAPDYLVPLALMTLRWPSSAAPRIAAGDPRVPSARRLRALAWIIR